MRTPIYIPREVKDAIAVHITSAVENARDGFASGSEDEDVLTGHLGGCLRIRTQTVRVEQDEIRGDWRWSMNYYKFRGRGQDAAEKRLGADGIFVLTVDRGSRLETKALLFQAKKEWKNDNLLFRQSIKLSTWREAAIVINYTTERYEAYKLDDVIRGHGKNVSRRNASNLADTLGRDFPDCVLGDTSLLYESPEKRLIWKTERGELVATKFTVRHRIKLKIQSPKAGSGRRVDREIPNAEVYNHRMEATEEEMLSLSTSATPAELKAAYAKAALVYHPDKYSDLDKLENAILNRRMQEMNHARDVLVNRRVR